MPFITFEGIDGSGKTTQANLLADHLKARGLSVVLTKEPGGTEFGRSMAAFMFDPGVDVKASLFLFLADRAQHVFQVVRPSLDAGAWVVCDRFCDSTLAYQGYGFGLDLNFLNGLNTFSTGGLSPDLTFVLDIPVSEARKRMGLREVSSGFDLMDDGFLGRVRKGFLELAGRFPERIVVLDGTLSADRIHGVVLKNVHGRFHGLL